MERSSPRCIHLDNRFSMLSSGHSSTLPSGCAKLIIRASNSLPASKLPTLSPIPKAGNEFIRDRIVNASKNTMRRVPWAPPRVAKKNASLKVTGLYASGFDKDNTLDTVMANRIASSRDGQNPPETSGKEIRVLLFSSPKEFLSSYLSQVQRVFLRLKDGEHHTVHFESNSLSLGSERWQIWSGESLSILRLTNGLHEQEQSLKTKMLKKKKNIYQ